MSGSSLLTSVVETRGHEFQRELADIILRSLTPRQRQRIRITTAPYGSNLPDIQVHHIHFPKQPVNIECKVGNSQGGAVTWNLDGSSWSVSPSSDKGKVTCERDPLFCAALAETLRSPKIMRRIAKVIVRHADFIPELATTKIPFVTVPEVWSFVLKTVERELNATSNGKEIAWKFPVESAVYWRNLNSAMHGSHFLAVSGKGLYRVGDAVFPEEWFMPSDTLMEAPRIDHIVADSGGMVEVRFKRGGKGKGDRSLVQRNRRMLIVGEAPPSVGDSIHVTNIGDASSYRKGLGLEGDGVSYVVAHPDEKNTIGSIQSLHHVAPMSEGYEIVCDFAHGVRTVTFETNLRISDMDVPTPISLEERPSIFTNCLI